MGFVGVFTMIAVIEFADVWVVFVVYVFVASLGGCFYADDGWLDWLEGD
jgi:hypothetical protein